MWWIILLQSLFFSVKNSLIKLNASISYIQAITNYCEIINDSALDCIKFL